ncbi:MAG TPA: polysaccharide biosynthesis/export family protein [Bacteroidia bacterium]|nr:polysaccharide biosynthesis/export family protein [Bacteroidia bacterium]
MLKAYLKGIFYLAVIGIFSFCANKKSLIYFQGNIANSEANKNYTPVLRPDDILSITVIGLDEQAVKPFNLPNPSANQAGNGSYGQLGQSVAVGYLLDADGNIDFPVLGKLKLGGLTRTDAIEYIKEQLKPFLSNPTILLRILNYKITVLGEVKNPGTFTIPNERITLPQALGIAGDLNITGVRKNILVIREVDGKKTETRVDLTSKDVYNSPVYYLQQNDVVYVQPNRVKLNSSAVSAANIGLVVSVISLIVTVSVLLTRH